jgi:predicted ATP-dependent endonuclease of OLD family
MIIPTLARIVLKNQKEGCKNLEDLGISIINLNGIYFKHFMQLYCNIITTTDDAEEKSVGQNIPVRCAGLTDLDPPKKVTKQIPDPENPGETNKVSEDFIPYAGNMKEGTNHALKLVDSISKSTDARLFVSKYKTLEYDLAMEGNNAALMSEVIASLWPKPKEKESSIIKEFTAMSKINWTEKSPVEVAEAAHKILKRIDDDNIGKGMFAQVMTDKIQNERFIFTVPEYIKDAILWATSLEFTEEE